MIRVLVAEDMPDSRDTLVSVLNLEEDIKVVAQVAAGPAHRARGAGRRRDVAMLARRSPRTCRASWSRMPRRTS